MKMSQADNLLAMRESTRRYIAKLLGNRIGPDIEDVVDTLVQINARLEAVEDALSTPHEQPKDEP